MKEETCQGCGDIIKWGTRVVAVRYGIIQARVSHTAVTKESVDYFHEGCDKAFRDVRE